MEFQKDDKNTQQRALLTVVNSHICLACAWDILLCNVFRLSHAR